MVATQERALTLWQDKVTTSVISAGSGDPVVFLHGESGLQWDPFLDALAEIFTVHAPYHPGTAPGSPDAIRSVDDLWDLVLYYRELLESLEVGPVPLIGHSFGGMVACEIAASFPDLVSKLVLIAPLGLWRDDEPVQNWMAMAPPVLVHATFHDSEGPLAQMVAAGLENVGADPERAASFVWALGCTGKFVWPIPDKGLKKRIHRIDSPTLLLWGKSDGIVPVSYAEDFRTRIRGARVEVIEEAGHVPQLEQMERVAGVVRSFLAR